MAGHLCTVFIMIWVHEKTASEFDHKYIWHLGPLLPCLTLIQAWISNYIHYEVWDEITYPFPNFKSCTIEVWKLIGNFIPHFMMDGLLIHAGIKVILQGTLQSSGIHH